MTITAYAIAGGYYKPGFTPNIIDAVSDLLLQGYIPYGTPMLSDTAGWVAQPMIKADSGAVTDYTVVTGYDDRRTPGISAATPVGWVPLGSTVWLSSHYYLQAYIQGEPYNGDIVIDLGTQVTGVLPIANGGTGADNAVDAFGNLTPHVPGYRSVFTPLTSPQRGAGGVSDELIILGLNAAGPVDGWGCVGVLRADRGNASSGYDVVNCRVIAGTRYQTTRSKVVHQLPGMATDLQELGTATYNGVSVIVGTIANAGGPFALFTFEGTTWGDSGGLLFRIIRRSDPLVSGYAKINNGVDSWEVKRNTLGQSFVNEINSQGAVVSFGGGYSSVECAYNGNARIMLYDTAPATVAYRNKPHWHVTTAWDGTGAANGSGTSSFPIVHIAGLCYGDTAALSNATHSNLHGLVAGQIAFAYGNAVNGFPESGVVSCIGSAPNPKAPGSTSNLYKYLLSVGYNTGYMRYRVQNGDGPTWLATRTVWQIASTAYSGSTAVDANGFVKAASPVIDIFGDGSFELNEESAGATVTRTGPGEYLVSGVLGFNSDSLWWMEVPKDVNGQALIWTDYTIEPDGDIIIRTYHRVHPDSPEYARNIIPGVENGDPIDITAGRRLTIRVNMPET